LKSFKLLFVWSSSVFLDQSASSVLKLYFSHEFPPKKEKAVFTVDEDKLIIKLIESMKADDGHIKWVKIAAHFSSRTSKQNRERYLNYLNPDVNRSPLSASELRVLTRLMSDNGHLSRISWNKISASFPGRSDIFLKTNMTMQEG
jgi:myb proto-oncogene protein